MKKSIHRLVPVLAIFILFTISCRESEPFTEITGIETQLYNVIKSHREANGITGAFVHQFLMVEEAQLFSEKLKNSTTELDTTGLSIHWYNIHNKIANGYNDATLIQSTSDETAADIIANWTADSASNAVLLRDYSQCGVGVKYGDNDVAFVTVFLMKVD